MEPERHAAVTGADAKGAHLLQSSLFAQMPCADKLVR